MIAQIWSISFKFIDLFSYDFPLLFPFRSPFRGCPSHIQPPKRARRGAASANAPVPAKCQAMGLFMEKPKMDDLVEPYFRKPPFISFIGYRWNKIEYRHNLYNDIYIYIYKHRGILYIRLDTMTGSIWNSEQPQYGQAVEQWGAGFNLRVCENGMYHPLSSV